MKKLLFFLCVIFFCSDSFAQSLSPETSTFESGQEYTITVNGESNSAYVSSVFYSSADNTSAMFGGTNYITQDAVGTVTSFQPYQTPPSHTKFKFKATNLFNSNIQVTFAFNVSGPGISQKRVTFTATIKPKPAATYYNVAMTQNFTKNNCGTGYKGSTVAYSVPANKYSGFSQTEANNKAQAEINANGQNNANANGTCAIDYSNWFTNWDTPRYSDTWDVGAYWNKNLVNTPTVRIEVYQYGVYKGVAASGIPNTGSTVLNFITLCTDSGEGFMKVKLRIVSEADPSISDFSPEYDWYMD